MYVHPEPQNVTLCGNRVFANIMKVRSFWFPPGSAQADLSPLPFWSKSLVWSGNSKAQLFFSCFSTSIVSAQTWAFDNQILRI